MRRALEPRLVDVQIKRTPPICTCGSFRACRRALAVKKQSAAKRALRAPLDRCSVWLKVAVDVDAKFPIKTKITHDFVANADAGRSRRVTPTSPSILGDF